MKICTSCQRYVQSNEEFCPFCQSSELSQERAAQGSGRGLSRARVFAARAVIASAALGTVAACGDDQDDDDNMTASGGQTANSGGSHASGGAAHGSGGDLVASGGKIELGAGGADADGGEGGDDGSVGIPIYGGPFPDMMKARV